MDFEPNPPRPLYIFMGVVSFLVIGTIFSVLLLVLCTAAGRIVVALFASFVLSLPAIGTIEDSLSPSGGKSGRKDSYTNMRNIGGESNNKHA